MSTSEMTRYVRMSSAAFDGATADDAGLYHDLVDSLAHLCDESAQVRVCFPLRSGVYLATQTPGSTSVWYPIGILGVWPMTVRADETPHLLRVRATGFAGANNNVTFRIVLAPMGRSAEFAQVATAPANVMESTVTSSITPVDLTLQVSGVTTRTIALSKALMTSARQSISAYDAVSGASPVSVDVAMVELSVWGKTSNVAATPQLSALYAAEYVGT